MLLDGEFRVLATSMAGAIERTPLLFIDSFELTELTVYELTYDLTDASQKSLMPKVRCLGSVEEARKNHGIGDPDRLLLEPGATEDVRSEFDGVIIFPGRVVSGGSNTRVHHIRTPLPMVPVHNNPPANRSIPKESCPRRLGFQG